MFSKSHFPAGCQQSLLNHIFRRNAPGKNRIQIPSGPGQEAFPGIQGNGFPRHPGMLFLLASLYRVFLSFLIFRADRHIPPHSFLSGRFRDTAGAFRRPASGKKPQTHKSAAGPEPLRTDSYRKSCKPPDAESGARQHEANLRQSAGNQSQNGMPGCMPGSVKSLDAGQNFFSKPECSHPAAVSMQHLPTCFPCGPASYHFAVALP